MAPLVIDSIFTEIDTVANYVGNQVYEQFTFSSEDDIDKYSETVGGLRTKVLQCFGEFDPSSVRVGLAANAYGRIDDNTSPADMRRIINEWESYWLLKTDMGLIWRTYVELEFLGDYKNNVWNWERVETKQLGSEQLLIDCTWKKAS